jgi:hypothetical protein
MVQNQQKRKRIKQKNTTLLCFTFFSKSIFEEKNRSFPPCSPERLGRLGSNFLGQL